jgi:hypothetical protein
VVEAIASTTTISVTTPLVAQTTLVGRIIHARFVSN